MAAEGNLSTDEYLLSLWGYNRKVHLVQELRPVLPPGTKLNEDIAEKIMYQLLNALDEKYQYPELKDHPARGSIGLLNEVKVGIFIKQLRHVEDILSSTHGITGRFYRDHFMHMVRVMLLSHAIGNILELNDNELAACTLAGLLHDIGLLPSEVSEGRELFNEMWGILRKGYTYLDDTELHSPKVSREKLEKSEFWIDITQWIDKSKIPISNHGILGSFEFLDFFDGKKVKENQFIQKLLFPAARGIANHDVEVGTTISYSQDPISTILILSDEMQEWGRPLGALGYILVPDIKSFQITKNKISATIDYSKCNEYCSPPRQVFETKLEEYTTRQEYFSPLSQVYAKQKNLNRIVLDRSFPELDLKFQLPKNPFTSTMTYADICDICPKMEHWDPFDLDVELRALSFNPFTECLDLLLDRHVVKSTFPHFKLFINPLTRELVVSTEQVLPAKISAHKNSKGKIQWDFLLSDLDDYRINFQLRRAKRRGIKSGSVTYRLLKKGEKTELWEESEYHEEGHTLGAVQHISLFNKSEYKNLMNLVNKNVLTLEEQAGCFAAVLQLCCLLQLDIDLLNLRYTVPLDEDLIMKYYSFLLHTTNRSNSRLFLLEKTPDMG